MKALKVVSTIFTVIALVGLLLTGISFQGALSVLVKNGETFGEAIGEAFAVMILIVMYLAAGGATIFCNIIALSTGIPALVKSNSKTYPLIIVSLNAIIVTVLIVSLVFLLTMN